EVTVQVTQQVTVPGASLVGLRGLTVHNTSTARRMFKTAVVVPTVTLPDPSTGNTTIDPLLPPGVPPSPIPTVPNAPCPPVTTTTLNSGTTFNLNPCVDASISATLDAMQGLVGAVDGALQQATQSTVCP